MKNKSRLKERVGGGVRLGVQSRLHKKVSFEQRPQVVERGRQEV